MKRKLSPAFEKKLAELDAAIAVLVRAIADDYFAACERRLPNPWKFDE